MSPVLPGRPPTSITPQVAAQHVLRARVGANRGREPRQWGECRQPEPSTIPDTPGSYQFKDARGPGHLRRQGEEPAQPAVELLRARPRRCCRAPARWSRRPRRSSGSRSATRSRRSSSSSTSSRSTGPASTSGCKDDKSYPFLAVTLDEEWPRAMVMRGHEAQGRPLLRAVRPRVRDPRDARPAAAHVPDPHVHQAASSTATTGSAGRASTPTSRSASAPCVGAVDHERVRRRSSTS